MVLKVIVVEINNFMDVWPPHISKRPLSLISLQAVARFPFNSIKIDRMFCLLDNENKNQELGID